MSRCWCPSCGGTDIQIVWNDLEKDFMNHCQDCGKLFGDEDDYRTKDPHQDHDEW